MRALDPASRPSHQHIERKRIEELFGWIKTVGGLRRTCHRARGLLEWSFVLTAGAYNLVRISKFLAATTG
jgi:hypothetical protein